MIPFYTSVFRAIVPVVPSIPEGVPSMQTTRPWLLLLLAAAVLALSACNTVEGAGKDIKRAGEKIEDAAK